MTDQSEQATPRARRRQVDRRNRQRDHSSQKGDRDSEVQELKQDADRQVADEQIAEWEREKS